MRLHEREIHGATVMAGRAEKPLILFEQDDKILVQKGYQDFTISAADARVFARKLNRLALRIEKRAAIAMEARRGETENTGSTAEGGDSAGPQDIAPIQP